MSTVGAIAAVKYDNGILIIGDTLLSYGNMARWHSISRIRVGGMETGRPNGLLVAGSGNYSDFQQILTALDGQLNDEYVEEKATVSTAALASYLSRWAYDRHRQGKALVVTTVLAGTRRDAHTGHTVPYLAAVRPNGMVSDTLPFVTTGFLAQGGTALYEAAAGDESLTLDEAKALLREVASLHWKRDAHSSNSFQFGQLTITAEGTSTVSVSEPFEVAVDWSYGKEAAPYFQQASATS